MKILTLDKNSKTSFSYLAGINRPINPSQVTKLANSVNKLGILRPVIIAEIAFLTGKAVKYIIDGQHLFNALLRNNLDIPYVVIKIVDKKSLVETIALLNASSKNWCILDYVTSWGSVSSDYQKLLKYYNIYDFELGIIASIFSGRKFCKTGGSSISTVIKNGSFNIINEASSTKVLDYLTDVLNILPRMNRAENNYLCSEYVMFLNNISNYNHKKFLKNLTEKKDNFLLATQGENKLSEMFAKLM
jgi:hypothetical protein